MTAVRKINMKNMQKLRSFYKFCMIYWAGKILPKQNKIKRVCSHDQRFSGLSENTFQSHRSHLKMKFSHAAEVGVAESTPEQGHE